MFFYNISKVFIDETSEAAKYVFNQIYDVQIEINKLNDNFPFADE